MNVEVWTAIGVIAGAIVGIAAALAVIWRGIQAVRRFGQSIAKMIYLIVGREGDEELGIAPIVGIADQFQATNAQIAELKASTDHNAWHMGNGGPVPMHKRVDEAVKETSKMCTELADLRAVIERRTADHGLSGRGNTPPQRHDDP